MNPRQKRGSSFAMNWKRSHAALLSALTAISLLVGTSSASASTPPPQPSTEVGLYTWPWETSVHANSISAVGFNKIRNGGGMTDALMTTSLEREFTILDTISPSKPRGAYATDELFIADYIAKVRSTLTRYGPGGTYFTQYPQATPRPLTEIEIINEPNFGTALGTTSKAKSDLYAKVLIETYAAVKAQWPSVTVVAFGAGGSSAAAPGFIAAVHNADVRVAQSYDVVSIHPYTEPNAPEDVKVEAWGSWSIAQSVEAVRKTQAAHGTASKPIWFTEIGWQIGIADGGRYDVGKAALSPSLQAAYNVRADLLAARLGVSRVYHMFTVDTDGFNGGYFTATKWRASATATQKLLNLLDGPIVNTEVIADGPIHGYYAYKLTSDKGTILALWSDSPRTVLIPTTDEYTQINTPDGKVTVTTEDSVKIELEPGPTYLSATTGPCKWA